MQGGELWELAQRQERRGGGEEASQLLGELLKVGLEDVDLGV
jgi:hypothetical protein